jgi:membrane-bound lytic murein transglycosylase D
VATAALACGPAIRPAPPPAAPAPDREVEPPAASATAQSAAAADGQADSVAGHLASLVPSDSLTASLHDAIAATAAQFGLPDSVLMIARPRPDSTPPPLAEAEEEEEEASWDIDVASYVTHERVTRYVDLYTGTAKARIESRLRRGQRYEEMIRAKFRAAGIPEDMYYLALVESGYDPHAYSRAAAVGMWQFMSSTARGVGLRVDWWTDERRDPAKATDAAARFLKMLEKQFGSYYLAAAAYNGGPGRVSRGLSRFAEDMEDIDGDDKFFALADQKYLRAETKNYVPQLIAAALIGKEPKRYGFALDTAVVPFGYDSVLVPALTPLAAVATAVDTVTAVVRDLNGHFLRGVTPPDRVSWVRVPVGTHAMFAARFDSLPDESRVAFDTITTTKGQTLASIAQTHATTARALQAFNRRLRYASKTRVAAGQTLLVPRPYVVAAARDVPDPGIERYGSTRSASGRVVHVVRRGESLGSIAKRYRTSVATLTRLNGLKRKVIFPGQSIVVRGTPRRATVARGKAPSTKKPAASTPKAAGSVSSR